MAATLLPRHSPVAPDKSQSLRDRHSQVLCLKSSATFYSRVQVCLARAELGGGNGGSGTESTQKAATASATTVDREPQGVTSAASVPRTTGVDRREAALEEYKQLKEELTRLTANITALGSAYCFLGYSLETASSFAFGCIFSVAYLQELFKAADNASRKTVPQVFQGRLPRKKTSNFVDSLALLSSPGRLTAGVKFSLTSPRLLLPGFMMLAWSASLASTGGDMSAPHLQLAPLLLGFLTYKASVLVVTFRGQLDLF